MKIADILKMPQFAMYSETDIQRVVETNSKQRFKIEEKLNELYIRANQGHSLQVSDLGLHFFLILNIVIKMFRTSSYC